MAKKGETPKRKRRSNLDDKSGLKTTTVAVSGSSASNELDGQYNRTSAGRCERRTWQRRC